MSLRVLLLVSVLVATLGSRGFGAAKYWDTNGSTAGAGGSGTPGGVWDNSGTGNNNNWNSSADGTGPAIGWTNSDAVFAAGTDATGSYNIQLVGNPKLSSLTVEEGSPTITGNIAGNTLDFGTNVGAPISIASGASFNESNSIVFIGTGGLGKTGAGTLVLRGTNTFSKSGTGSQAYLRISEGAVDFTSEANLGATPSAFNASALTLDGGTLRYSGTTDLSWTSNRGISIGASGGTYDVSTAHVLNVGAVSGSGMIAKTGIGRLQMPTASNSFGGKYLVNGGSIGSADDSGFGPIPVAVVPDYFFLDGGALRTDGNHSPTINLKRGITLGSNGGTLIAGSFGMSYAGTIAGASGGGLSISLHDGLADTEFGNSVSLTGTNTYDGPTTINYGMTLSTNNLANGGVDSGIGRSSNAAGNLIFNGGILRYSGTDVSVDRNFTLAQNGGEIDSSNSNNLSLAFTSTDPLSFVGAGAKRLTLGGTSTSLGNTLAAAIVDNGLDSTTLAKNGHGKWTITNPNNSYTGDTTINDGTLLLGAAGVIPDRSRVVLGSITSTLDLNGYDETVKSISGFSGSIVLGDKTLTLNDAADGFSGVISGNGGSLVISRTHVLALAGVNTYTGNTVINGGTLSISNSYLADGADVRMTGTASLELRFTGTDTIRSLFLNGASQAMGTWGSLDSSATHKTSLIIGSGMLLVTTQVSGVAGDYNNDGVVDAADYVVWRDNLGTGNALLNDGGLGTPVGQAHYNFWRAHFGAALGSGSGEFGAAAVPEPAGVLYVALVVAGVLMWRRNWVAGGGWFFAG